MRILVGTETHFEGNGGPYYAISNKLKYLYKNHVKFKLIFQKTDGYDYSLNFNEIVEDFDIVHIYGLWRPFILKLYSAAKKQNKKIILSPLGGLEPWAMNQKKFKKLIGFWLYQKKILNSCDIIHATSAIEELNIKKLGINSKSIIIPHGIDFINLEKKKEQNNIKKAIFFSRIHEKKGLLELIETWSELNPKNWILEVYGPVSNFSYLNQVKKTIRILNLESQIKIFDPIYKSELKRKVFLSANCFLLPSKSENFGISIGEALAHSLPVLTTTATPWSEIEEYNAGKVFKMNKDNLKENLGIFLSHSTNELEIMGSNGKKLIDEKYNHDLIIKKYIKMYESLM